MMWLWLAIFIVFFALGYPVAFGMMISSIIYLMVEHVSLFTIINLMVIKFESQFILLSVPLFIFAATVMNSTQLTDRLFGFANDAVGSLKGGMGHVNILASIIFAGMSGSEIADVSGLGMVEIKAMRSAGYDGPFSCAVTAASATIGPIIPPSIPIIIYGMLSGVSVGYLFLAGIIPGLVLAACLMVLVYFISIKRNYPTSSWKGIKHLLGSLRKSFLILMAPGILLFGIYSGIFTPTEAAAIVGVYVVILALIYRQLNIKQFFGVLSESVLKTGYIAFVVACSFLFSYVVAREEIPALITNAFTQLGLLESPWAILLFVNILFLALGCFIDVSAILLIVVPIVLPLVTAAGIDPVHFGIVTVLNLMIALDTPPYGETGFITSAISGVPLKSIFREMFKFIIFELIALFIITYIPSIVLWLPKLAGYA